ncbi:MAG TPA: recombinase [Burkholderiaceae bacterium]|nr:recombinase [Burkholderiaceae bacterium]
MPLFGRNKAPPWIEGVRAHLDAMGGDQGDPIARLAGLVAQLRPARGREAELAPGALHALVDELESHPERRGALARDLRHVFATRSTVGFFTDSGILPATGFFSEMWRILGNRLLPEVPDERELRGCLHRIFDRREDWRWLAELPEADVDRLWRALQSDPAFAEPDAALTDEMLESTLVLAYRVSGMGIETELKRVGAETESVAPSFRAVAREAQRFVDSQRARLLDPSLAAEDERQLLVIIDQCIEVLARAKRAAKRQGTSLALTFLMKRSLQSLRRLEVLARTLGARVGLSGPPRKQSSPAAVLDAVRAEAQRNSMSRLAAQTMNLLALRVTDNAARTGEHYITSGPDEYRAMLGSAMGAGLIIAAMALLKIFTSKLTLPLAGYAILYSLNYGLGFVLIYMLHLTIATKQPAMTAQTIAGYLGGDGQGIRGEAIERIVDLIAAVSRSQMAAIVGNVIIALPTAMLIGLVLQYWSGHPPLAPEKGAILLADLNPLSWAPWYAAIAGVFLFLSGLISGYFDNKAAYDHIGERVERLGWLRSLAGPERARRVGAYIQEHLGGLSGNFLFGVMLGTAGTVGVILGLPIDIRHIAFSSANLGYAMVAFDFHIEWHLLAWSALGVAVIGFVNLSVSFTLALWMALKARAVVFTQTPQLLRALWRRLRAEPGIFFRPPRVRTEDEDGEAS